MRKKIWCCWYLLLWWQPLLLPWPLLGKGVKAVLANDAANKVYVARVATTNFMAFSQVALTGRSAL